MCTIRKWFNLLINKIRVKNHEFKVDKYYNNIKYSKNKRFHC